MEWLGSRHVILGFREGGSREKKKEKRKKKGKWKRRKRSRGGGGQRDGEWPGWGGGRIKQDVSAFETSAPWNALLSRDFPKDSQQLNTVWLLLLSHDPTVFPQLPGACALAMRYSCKHTVCTTAAGFSSESPQVLTWSCLTAWDSVCLFLRRNKDSFWLLSNQWHWRNFKRHLLKEACPVYSFCTL